MSTPQVLRSESPSNWPSARSLFTDVASDIVRMWRDLAAAHLLASVVATVVLTPLATALLRFCVRFSGVPALADVDILYFVLTNPIGFLGMVLVGGVGLTIALMEYAMLMTIGYASSQGGEKGWRQALIQITRRSPTLLRLATFVVARTLITVAPLLGIGGLAYWLLLTQYDINYYLVEKPPAFWVATGFIGAALMIASIIVLRLVTGWILSIPVLLFEHSTPLGALRASWSRTLGRRRSIVLWLFGWYLTTSAVLALAQGLVILLGRLIVPHFTESLQLLALILGAFVLVSMLVHIFVAFVGASVLSLLVVRFYRAVARVTEPEVDAQQRTIDSTASSGRNVLTGPKLILGLAGAFVIAAVLGAVNLRGLQTERQPQIVAHRGASALAPENTLAAFERAIADGANWVELDVQETADGEVVVIHDRDLKKLSNVNLRVWEATKEQLDRIDVGSRFGSQFRGQRVPTLGEVLDLCKGRVGVNIELKYYGRQVRLEERVVEIVESKEMTQQIVVMSLDYRGLRKIRALRRDWKVGLLKSVSIGDVTKLDVDFLAINSRTASPAVIDAAHRSGKQVFVWTVNDPVSMSSMVSRGVDGIITDNPAMAVSVLQQRADCSATELLLLELAQLFGMPARHVEQ